MTRGVVYVASGPRHVKLAAESARSVERYNPTLPTTIYTTAESPGDAFDRVVRLDDPLERAGDSILTAGRVPYDRNLYLDADTLVRDDISDVFELLETTDLALAQNNARTRLHADVYEDVAVEIPETFTEYNSGVVAYNDCADVIALFDEWARQYERIGGEFNQPALRVALYRSDVDFVTLPPEYNFMTNQVGYACGRVKILHRSSSPVELATFADAVNRSPEPRVTTWDDYPCRVVPESHRTRRYVLEQLLNRARRKRRRDGTLAVLKAGVERMF
jgi:hypothetical protein